MRIICSSLCAILAICTIVGLVRCCPFADFGLMGGNYNDCLLHHPKEMCDELKMSEGGTRSLRKLLGAPGTPPLPDEDISLKNNAFSTAGTILSDVLNGLDLIDVVSGIAGGLIPGAPEEFVGMDMCVWNFQSLPPPPGPDGQYKVPALDAVLALEHCNGANDKFQSEIGADKNDGALVFGGCTLGARASKDVCEFDINSEVNARYCNEPTQTSSIRWPQAVTMFKVRPATSLENKENAALKAFVSKWRNSEQFHLSARRWVMEGGTGSARGSVVGGWGAGGGGIYRKVVPCDAIDPKFLYPAPFAPEALNAAVRRPSPLPPLPPPSRPGPSALPPPLHPSRRWLSIPPRPHLPRARSVPRRLRPLADGHSAGARALPHPPSPPNNSAKAIPDAPPGAPPTPTSYASCVQPLRRPRRG